MKIQWKYDEFLNTMWLEGCVMRIFYFIANDAYSYIMDFFFKNKEYKKVFNYVVFFTYIFYTSIVIQYSFGFCCIFVVLRFFFFFNVLKNRYIHYQEFLFHFWYRIECVNMIPTHSENILVFLIEIQQTKYFHQYQQKTK